MGSCPHRNIIHCPLYVAAHTPDGIGCISGDWHLGCSVERGGDYANEVEKVRAKHPRMVAELAFAESAAEANEQRRRNMRALGMQ